MKLSPSVLVLALIISPQVGAQDVRSKVGSASEKSFTKIIDPGRSIYGAQWGTSEDDFIKMFGSPTGYLRLNSDETVMIYGRDHAFLFIASKLSGVRITYSIIDATLSQAVFTHTPFDGVKWELSNGVRKDMNLADIKKIVGDNLKNDQPYRSYFDINGTTVDLNFAHFPREGEKDEAYKVHGLFIRQAISRAAAAATILVRRAPSAVPDATRPCTPEVAKWWQEVRAAAGEVVAAMRHREQALSAWVQAQPPTKRAWPDSDDVLPQNERDKLKAELTTAREKYRLLLAEVQVKSYRAPVDDSPIIILHREFPTYTEEARRKKTNGTVSMRVEFRGDGTIGAVNVIRGLGDGLDEQAIKAVQHTIFLPSVKDGMFVTTTKMMQADFALR